MRDISTKVDGTTTLPATAFNSTQVELENIVTDTGQSLDPDGGADTDLYMLSKSSAIYSSDSGFYTDSGTANVYVLSRVGSLQHPEAYFDGMMVEFKAANSNTGACNVNVAGLGVKVVRAEGGGLLVRGEIIGGKYVKLRYRTASGQFEIVRRIYRNIVTYTTGTPSYTKPNGLAFVKATVIGGGGGGGGVDGQGGGTWGGATGGGGGGAAIKIIPASLLGGTETVTVGDGGFASGAGNADGGDGGTSSFGTHCSATGGKKGIGVTAQTYSTTGVDAVGGVGASGDINVHGGLSPKPVILGSGSNKAVSGAGGSSMLGMGARGLENSGNGIAGRAGGGGGSGAFVETSSSNYAGGAGGAGIVVIEEYF